MKFREGGMGGDGDVKRELGGIICSKVVVELGIKPCFQFYLSLGVEYVKGGWDGMRKGNRGDLI